MNSNIPGEPRILVVRLGAMGDVIHGLPAVTALRAAFPQSHIGWIIEERWIELLTSEPAITDAGRPAPRSKARPLVDAVHPVNTFRWRKAPFSPQTWRELSGLLRQLRQADYQAAIDIQGAWKSALLARLSGAALTIGFERPRESGAAVFYNRRVSARGAHVVEQNISLLRPLLPPDQGKSGQNGESRATGTAASAEAWKRPSRMQLPYCEANEAWAAAELGRRGLAGAAFAVINPGAGWGAKCWPAERYAELARGLGQCGVPSLINIGSEEESLARMVEEGSGGAAQALSCGIGQLIALLRRARLFVGGDTGPMHLAAALGVPVVAIFGPTDPARNGPYATESIVLRRPESITSHERRVAPEPAMLTISAAEVLEAARQLLEHASGRAVSQEEVDLG